MCVVVCFFFFFFFFLFLLLVLLPVCVLSLSVTHSWIAGTPTGPTRLNHRKGGRFRINNTGLQPRQFLYCVSPSPQTPTHTGLARRTVAARSPTSPLLPPAAGVDSTCRRPVPRQLVSCPLLCGQHTTNTVLATGARIATTAPAVNTCPASEFFCVLAGVPEAKPSPPV